MSNNLNNRVVTTEIYDSDDEYDSDDNYDVNIDIGKNNCEVEDEDTEEFTSWEDKELWYSLREKTKMIF